MPPREEILIEVHFGEKAEIPPTFYKCTQKISKVIQSETG